MRLHLGQQKREPGAPRDPDALAQEQEDQKPSSSKSSRTSSRENDNEPRSKRVSSTGKEGDKQTRGIKSEKIQSDDGSLEYKEKLSPGSTDKKKISDNKSSTNEDVPDEVKEKLHADTINMIKKESGMSGGMGS